MNFNGDAAAAIALYERVLGARVESIQRFGDAPGGDPVAPHKDRVMHAVVHVGRAVLMISDSQPDNPVSSGTNVHLTLEYDDAAEMRTAFDALAEGGAVAMPLQDTFWGATFGMLTDQHGVGWM